MTKDEAQRSIRTCYEAVRFGFWKGYNSMGQGKFGSKLGRTTSHRKAMLRTMVTSLLKYEKIQTTDMKAKELKKVADKMITLGKRGDLHARRQAAAYVRERDMVSKLFGEMSERYKDRAGGYTRVVKSGYRAGDNAPMSIIEFVRNAEAEKPKKKALAPKK
jgi:large subunit ribosomal protein L17